MHDRELAKSIQNKLVEVSNVFGQFQQKVGLLCPANCGKCCFKSDIYCSPYELLPMAYYLIDNGQAEEILEKARVHKKNSCLFLDIKDGAQGTGRCLQYNHRPFICRAFGLSARYGKHKVIERSICKTLNEMEKRGPHHQMIEDEIPLIDIWKKNLESIDPQLLGQELPIEQGLIFLLEKLLLKESFR